jgi:hypothetical protein
MKRGSNQSHIFHGHGKIGAFACWLSFFYASAAFGVDAISRASAALLRTIWTNPITNVSEAKLLLELTARPLEQESLHGWRLRRKRS